MQELIEMLNKTFEKHCDTIKNLKYDLNSKQVEIDSIQQLVSELVHIVKTQQLQV